MRWLVFHWHYAKNFKTFQKNVSIPRMDKRKPHTREFHLKSIGGNMRCKLLQKRSTRKTTECSKHLRHIAIEKYIFSELNRCIFQISLKYIKLVILKILFVLVLCSFNFYFKITDPPPPKQNYLTPPADFSEIFNPPSPLQAGGGVHALYIYHASSFNGGKIRGLPFNI